MNAQTARQLRPGDYVVSAFGTSHRRAKVVSIQWPHIVVAATMANGEDREQQRQYRSLFLVDEYKRKYGDYNH